MRTVYLLQSLSDPTQRYVGTTCNFGRRLEEHNSGNSPHTSKSRPWKAVVVIQFEDDSKADHFEEYLKSGSGHEFSKKHFW